MSDPHARLRSKSKTERGKTMWTTETVTVVKRNAVRSLTRPVCTECGYKSNAGGYINLAALVPCKCGK